MPIEYNHDHENEITLFAETNFRNAKRRFGIKTDDRRRHMYILGKTGMGKTTLMENMILSDIMAGHGVCYVDPHGDTAEKILDYIPSYRINDVVYFNPADMDYPLGFNILETVDDSQKHLIAAGLMNVFKKIWPDVWSPRMEYILQNCVLALLDYPGATLLGISRLLVDVEYRKRVIAKIRDPIVKTFWVAEFSSWSEKYATEAIAPVQNKVGQFLSASVIRNIVAQVKSTVDMRRIMDEGKILIVNLSKGRIGEDNMRLLGGIIITKLQLTAMERVDMPEAERRDFYLYVDEFQNFANESFANILSEARKYHLNLIVAHQYIKQLAEEVAWAVFGNVGTLIIFRVGTEDAAFMENEFMPVYTPEDLVNLTKFEIYLKLMVDGAATQPFSANTLPPIAQRTQSTEKVIAVSRERYATPKALIEEKVLRWSGMELGDGEKLEYPDIKTEDEREAEEASGGTEKPKSFEEENESGGGGEYLKISDERLASIVKPPQGQKKDKPKFSHTCTRCGKVWDMPIQLDASRPIYCAECLPIVREERKLKTTVSRVGLHGDTRAAELRGGKFEDARPANKLETKLRDTFSAAERGPSRPPKHQPNKPRFTGETRSLPPAPPKATIRFVPADTGDDDRMSLLAELTKGKGGKVETDKDKLTQDIRHQGTSANETAPATPTVFKHSPPTNRPTTQNQPSEPGAFEVRVELPATVNPLDKRFSHGKNPYASGHAPKAAPGMTKDGEPTETDIQL
ncbi:type IV secretion system DNA-binding domain-containing protein [Candidatus Uhrbacteria bacterium]|nr:type IV secretion system DNA-binding domain-containing protein [Candidatus Uhrbacteria bacterium]